MTENRISGFIATPETQDADSEIIPSDTFYPPISIQNFTAVCRLPITTKQAREYLLYALTSLCADLQKWRNRQKVATLITLHNNSKITDNGITLAEFYYICAINHKAKAKMLVNYFDFDTTKDGQQNIELRKEKSYDERANYTSYIQKIQIMGEIIETNTTSSGKIIGLV